MSADARPLTVLIAALGGEGGAVLANWIVAAAALEGYAAQSTSIPGVAQRTGATTYYIELYPLAGGAPGEGPQPVMALTPFPGNIDVMVASELVEAGRALQNGFVTRERTTLVASTHRIYAMQEKTAMADARYDASRVCAAAARMARRAVLFDMEATARSAESLISAVLLGAIAGSDALPLRRSSFVEVIQSSGIAVEANLRGFGRGCNDAETAAQAGAPSAAPRPTPHVARGGAADVFDRVRDDFPAPTREVLRNAVLRLVDYQDELYAQLFLDRLEPVRDLDAAAGGDAHGWALTTETARQLALRMSYEDVIRVADLKTRASRYARVRAEVDAGPDERVIISEYLKPGVEELCSILPAFAARPLLRSARTRGFVDRLNLGLRVKTTTVSGFALLRALAGLRRWRPRSWRYGEEQTRIECWLDTLRRAAAADYDFGLEVVALAGIIKGYGSTHRRGLQSYETIMTSLVEPALAAGAATTEGIAKARQAALADPEGTALAELLSASPAPTEPAAPPQTPTESRSSRAQVEAGEARE